MRWCAQRFNIRIDAHNKMKDTINLKIIIKQVYGQNLFIKEMIQF